MPYTVILSLPLPTLRRGFYSEAVGNKDDVERYRICGGLVGRGTVAIADATVKIGASQLLSGYMAISGSHRDGEKYCLTDLLRRRFNHGTQR